MSEWRDIPIVSGETLDVAVEWEDELRAGDAIATSVWNAPAQITINSDGKAGTRAVAWVSVSVTVPPVDPPISVTLVNTITTTAGRTQSRDVRLRIVDGKAR